VNHDYLDTIAAVERLHRRCLEVIKTELDRSGVRDINNIQSLILCCYHGSNVSYNLKKLVDFGYVSHRRSSHDRRSYRVKLTEKGIKIRGLLQEMFARHADALGGFNMDADVFSKTNDVLLRLDRFWASQSDAYGMSDKALSRVA